MVEETPLDVGSGPDFHETQPTKFANGPAQETDNEKLATSEDLTRNLEAVKLDEKPSKALNTEPVSTSTDGTVEQSATETACSSKKSTEKPPSASIPQWPEISADHPLSKFLNKLADILKSTEYHEVYGVDISDPKSFHTKLILQKFLRANANDLQRAEEQLRATLEWRKEFQPLKLLEVEHSKEKFGGLGYVTHMKNVPGSSREEEIVTWNIYGAVKDNKKTFGDLDSFIRWRVALMELSLRKLNLASATSPIPDYASTPTAASRDPYQAIQVHDYLNISFLRQDPTVKAASKKAIEVFQKYYPETLSRKFFVNVPVLMGWMFNAMKLFLSKETVRKFTVLSYGEQLVGELGKDVPKVYGGEGEGLDVIGEQTKLV